jgi:hypothetical protein
MIFRVCVGDPTDTTSAAPPSVLPAPSATELFPVDWAAAPSATELFPVDWVAVPMAILLPPLAVVDVLVLGLALSTIPVDEPIAMLPFVCVPEETCVVDESPIETSPLPLAVLL